MRCFLKIPQTWRRLLYSLARIMNQLWKLETGKLNIGVDFVKCIFAGVYDPCGIEASGVTSCDDNGEPSDTPCGASGPSRTSDLQQECTGC